MQKIFFIQILRIILIEMKNNIRHLKIEINIETGIKYIIKSLIVNNPEVRFYIFLLIISHNTYHLTIKGFMYR